MSTVSVTNLKHESASGNNITLDSSGNVGIGTATPSTYGKFVVNNSIGGASGRVVLDGNVTSGYTTSISATDNGMQLWAQSNSRGITFNTGSTITERMRIDSSGRVTMPYQPAFRAYGSASYDVRTAPVNFNSVIFNIGGHYNTSTYRFTAPVAGTYWFGVYGIAQSTSGQGGLNIRVNGTAHLRSYHLPNERTRGVTGIFYLNANDYVDIGLEDLDTYYLANYAYFAGYLIG